MAEETKIGWCRNSDGTAGATFNPWCGCSKVSPGCDLCYAETWSRRAGKDVWGPGVPRQRTTEANWRQPLKWDAAAAKKGIRQRIFCASLADVFDNEVPQEWRDDLWALIRKAPNCDWIIVTKRIGNAPKMLPADWGDGYPNVWLCATVVNQTEADRDIPKLLAVQAAVHGLSIEPMLVPINLTRIDPGIFAASANALTGIWKWDGGPSRKESAALNWVKIGGESGANGRSMDIASVRDLLRQTRAAGVATYVKQLGRNPELNGAAYPVTGKGDDSAEWPEDIRVQEVPLTGTMKLAA
ncbi:MAG: DUF5131 family protein [Rhodospirillaceae bacterium]